MNTADHGNADRRCKLLLAARLLPLATVVAWIITIVVPIIDSNTSDGGNEEGPSPTITSMGHSPVLLEYLDHEAISIWIGILTLAILPWLVGSSKWWSAAAVLFGAALLWMLSSYLITPPIMMWDGQTEDGTPTGGMEVGRPAPGFAVYTIGALALTAAGICGWISSSGSTAALRHRGALDPDV